MASPGNAFADQKVLQRNGNKEIVLVNYNRFELLEGIEDSSDMQDCGECVRILFHREEQNQRVGVNRPRVANLIEMKLSLFLWLKDNAPEMLGCKMEQYFHGRGMKYCGLHRTAPSFNRPIFWAAGKNHVALLQRHALLL